jgi:hypothetical protein
MVFLLSSIPFGRFAYGMDGLCLKALPKKGSVRGFVLQFDLVSILQVLIRPQNMEGSTNREPPCLSVFTEAPHPDTKPP